MAVWGCGAVGLAAIMGSVKAGATRIIAIDINPDKWPAGVSTTVGLSGCVYGRGRSGCVYDRGAGWVCLR